MSDEKSIVVVAEPVTEPVRRSTGYAKGVRDMLMESLDRLGGASYLTKLAHRDPRAYAALLAKCIPQAVEVKGEDGKPIAIYFPPL